VHHLEGPGQCGATRISEVDRAEDRLAAYVVAGLRLAGEDQATLTLAVGAGSTEPQDAQTRATRARVQHGTSKPTAAVLALVGSNGLECEA
jgi:hypothetical protein